MQILDVVDYLISKLIDLGFIVHRYDAFSTNSVYLKLDYGLSCGIRISDHQGKKKYSYRFNVLKDYKGKKVIIKDGLICLFFDFNELEYVLDAVLKKKQEKINKYGLKNYELYMEQQMKSDLYKRFKNVKGETKK